MNVEVSGELLDGVVPYTEPLKDNRRTRVKSSGRPPSQYFLKENILHLDEDQQDDDDVNATGDSENNHQTDSVTRTRPASLVFKTFPSNENIKMATTPPWLEELRKKKQIKLQRNSSESIIIKNTCEESNNVHHEEKVSPSSKPALSTTDDNQQEEKSWGIQLRKKRNSIIEEDPINNRVSTNTILVVNNSTKNASPPTKNPPPIPSTAPPSIYSSENFLPPQNDEYLTDEDDAEIMEVMSPVNLDKKLSIREIETNMGTVTSGPLISDGDDIVFEEVSSITLVKPLTRSESLNRHNLRTYGHNSSGNLLYKQKSTENVSSDNYEGVEQKGLNLETKLRFLRIIEQMEHIVNKNAVENETIKKELEAVIEENKLLSKSLDKLKAEIGRL